MKTEEGWGEDEWGDLIDRLNPATVVVCLLKMKVINGSLKRLEVMVFNSTFTNISVIL